MAAGHQQSNGGKSRSVDLGFAGLLASAGDHIGHFYSTKAEWKELLVPFLYAGLRAGEKCVALMNPATPKQEILDELMAFGIDVDEVLGNGQLVVSEGKSTPKELEQLLMQSVNEIPGRYSLLRWSGEMTWYLGKMATTELLMEWETTCNVVESSSVVFFCQYDLTIFPGNVVMDALKTHPLCIIGSAIHQNPFYEDPESFLREIRSRR